MTADWRALLASALPEEDLKQLRTSIHTGRPLKGESFLTHLEGVVSRNLEQ